MKAFRPIRRRIPLNRRRVCALALAIPLIVAACGGDDDDSGASTSEQDVGDASTEDTTDPDVSDTTTGDTTDPDVSDTAADDAGAPNEPNRVLTEITPGEEGTDVQLAALAELVPDDYQDRYEGFWHFAALGENPYSSWEPPEPPWQFCYNDSFQGNAWRQAALAEVEALVDQWVEAGLAEDSLPTTGAEGDIATQISQLNGQVQEGCEVIFTIPGSASGLCGAIDDAFSEGVLVIGVESTTSCDSIINNGFNEYVDTVRVATWLGEAMGGEGNLLLVNGIPGFAPATARRQAVVDTMENDFPGVEIVGEIDGGWDPAQAKSSTLQYLASNSEEIDAVFNAGVMGVSISEAFTQVGRDRPIINGFTGSCRFLAFWNDNDLDSFSLAQGGSVAAFEAFEIAARMLHGQQPALNTILEPLPEINAENFAEWHREDMTTEDSCFADPPEGRRSTAEYYDGLFTGGSPVDPAPQPVGSN